MPNLSPAEVLAVMELDAVSAYTYRRGCVSPDDLRIDKGRSDQAIAAVRAAFAELAELRAMTQTGKQCESGQPECGPVTNYDSEGVPLCAACWAELGEQWDNIPLPPPEPDHG